MIILNYKQSNYEMLKRINSKLDSKMCNYEEDSINNNKQTETVKDKQQNHIEILPLNILETCNFKILCDYLFRKIYKDNL